MPTARSSGIGRRHDDVDRQDLRTEGGRQEGRLDHDRRPCREAREGIAFVIDVEDSSTGGVGRFWIETRDGDGTIIVATSMGGDATTSAAVLDGGRISVRYTATR